MDMQMYPFVSAYAFQGEEGTHFLLPGREIILQGADEVLLCLLQKCTGYKALEEVVSLTTQETDCAKEDLLGLVEELMQRRVLVDASQYYLLFHEVSANPMPFGRWLSEEDIVRMLQEGESPLVQPPFLPQSSLEGLLEQRESVRAFTGELLSQEEIARLAWVLYGRVDRSNNSASSIGLGTVPSGGALYPLRLFVFVRGERSWKQFKAGPKGLEHAGEAKHEDLVHIFLGDPTLFKGVAAVYVLACDFRQTSQKYSNRGYRFALLEAGHAAQNAYLWCAEQGLGVVEIGGFEDQALADLLSLSYPYEAPLTTLLVGRRLRDES